MEQLVLKPEVLEKIKDDPMLFGKVASVLGLKTRGLTDLLPKNPPRMATASVLRVLREHLNVTEDNELLVELTISEPAA